MLEVVAYLMCENIAVMFQNDYVCTSTNVRSFKMLEVLQCLMFQNDGSFKLLDVPQSQMFWNVGCFILLDVLKKDAPKC